MIDIEALLKKSRELAPLPASTIRLASLATASGSTPLSEIVDVIAYDQALTLKLLKSANSVYEHSELPITDARDAVFRLGVARVLALSVATAVNPLLRRDVSQYGFAEGALWQHSVATAASAEVLPDFCEHPIPPETFTAALLHDVGKLVMGRFLSPEVLEALQRARNEGGLDACAAETRVLGINHAELGGSIVRNWKLPEGIANGIIYHHDPAAGGSAICDAVSLANAVAKSVEGALPLEGADEGVLVRLGVDPDKLDGLVSIASAKFASVRAVYYQT